LSESSRNPPRLILLTDDRRNREIAAAHGLLVASARDYVDGLVGGVRQGLVDLVVGGVDEIEPGERRGRRIYDEVSGFLKRESDYRSCEKESADMSFRSIYRRTRSTPE
jgi:hypothetical protein